MATTGKLLIPVELLRRSCRNHKAPATSNTTDQLIKKELHHSANGRATDKKPPARGNDTHLESKKLPIVKQEPNVDEPKLVKGEIQPFRAEPDGYLSVDCDELDLERTLMGGQSFRWTKTLWPDDKQLVFKGVIGNDALQLWRCDEGRIAFRKLNKDGHQTGEEVEALLVDYFQLKYKSKDLYKHWSRCDEHFAKCSQFYRGFRILRQNPVENVFSFICATNNNIKRISLMIDKMCRRFGQQLDEKCPIDEPSHAFPTVERLASDDVFDCLRYDLGFGYRAKFISESAKKVLAMAEAKQMSPAEYLLSLRELPYKDTCKQLQAFPGIGRKVADCICLMSMDHLNSVPIDCHIYEIVCRNYMPNLRHERKTLTESVHDLIGNYFNELHGPLAGWATSVLFIAELKHLKQAGSPGGGETKTTRKKKEKSGDGCPVKTAQSSKRRKS